MKAARPKAKNGQRRTPKGHEIRYYDGVQLSDEGILLLKKKMTDKVIAERNATRGLSQVVAGCLGLPKGNLADLAISGVRADPPVSG